MSTRTEPADPTKSDSALVSRLDRVERSPMATAMRARTYELLSVTPGDAVVDVGCGTGRAVAEMRERGVTAIGVDPSEHMVAVARSRLPGGDFRLCAAEELPFTSGTLQGYRADKVLHELPDPAQALREAHRVLAPGGRIVLVGQDFDGILIDSDDPALTRTIVQARADEIPQPRAARRYRNLLLDAGFAEVTVEIYAGQFTGTLMLPAVVTFADAARAADAITREQAEAWVAEQTARAEADRMSLVFPVFVASALRP